MQFLLCLIIAPCIIIALHSGPKWQGHWFLEQLPVCGSYRQGFPQWIFHQSVTIAIKCIQLQRNERKAAAQNSLDQVSTSCSSMILLACYTAFTFIKIQLNKFYSMQYSNWNIHLFVFEIFCLHIFNAFNKVF